MASLTLKVTYQADTRKISGPPEQIMESIATRFELPPGTPFQLLHNQQVVTIPELSALTESDPGKALKVDMISVLPPAYTPVTDNTNGWDTWPCSNDLKHEPDPSPISSLQQRAYIAKQSARMTKQEAKRLAQHAKTEMRTAKEAAKAFKQAAKAADRAKKAAKHVQGAGPEDVKQGNVQVIPGKLVNFCQPASPAAVGELIILPCNRICFHCLSHPANLRVNSGAIQKGGGRGEAAQFEAVVTNETTQYSPEGTVYRLASVIDPQLFLGVAPCQSMEGALSTLHDGMFEFAPVSADSAAGLWSFFPQGCHSPIELAPPEAMPTARDVYIRLQEAVSDLAECTRLPIHLAEAPTDECELIRMINAVHDYLPHAVKRIAMKKIGLRNFELPEPEIREEWAPLLADLVEMGFEDPEQNLEAVREAGGDLKKAIKTLVQSSLFKQ